MSDETILPAKHKSWEKAERELYAGCLARVIGETNHNGDVLVELMSGPLNGSRIWVAPDALQRKEGGS